MTDLVSSSSAIPERGLGAGLSLKDVVKARDSTYKSLEDETKSVSVAGSQPKLLCQTQPIPLLIASYPIQNG